MRKVMAQVAGALVAATLAMPAVAAERGFEQWQVRVQTADLDLSSATGQRALERRLSLAMTRLCGSPIIYSRDEIADLEACRADALQAAAPQIEAARSQRALAVASNR